MAFCMSSPQFFRRAISKSNLLLAVICCCCCICVVAASLHSLCSFLSSGKEKVSGFELQRDPRNPDGAKICVTLYEDIGTVEAFLPAPQLVTTTAVIATVATGSALLAKPLADLLLKVVKPVVKKAIGAIQKKLGKTPYSPTQAELRANKYREKKGLLPINFAKQHSQSEKKKKEESQKKE